MARYNRLIECILCEDKIMTLLFRVLSVLMVLMVFGTAVTMAQDVTPEPEPLGDVVNVGGVVADETLEERATITLRDAVISILLVVGTVITFITGAIGAIAVILSQTAGKVVAMVIKQVIDSTPAQFKPAVANAVAGGLVELQSKSAELKTFHEFDNEFVEQLVIGLTPLLEGLIDKRMTDHIQEAYRRAKYPVDDFVSNEIG